MMLISQDRILTTHTGSLPRPAELTALYVRRAARRGGRSPRLWTLSAEPRSRCRCKADRRRRRYRQ